MRRWGTVRGQAGYTLAEMLVVAAVLALVMSGMLSLLMTGSQTWLAGSNRAEAQQSTRLIVSRMAEEVRMGGWDPKATSSFPSIQALPPGQTGFVISNDWSANGTIETAAPVIVNGQNRGEQITYDVVSNTLRRRERPVDGSPVDITSAIASITFTYRDADDNVVPTPHVTANAQSIRTVEVTVTTIPDQAGSSTSGAFVTSTIRARVRNRS
jgi:prepilin-type N-terminal cleavage/methylation domain-containing protein